MHQLTLRRRASTAALAAALMAGSLGVLAFNPALAATTTTATTATTGTAHAPSAAQKAMMAHVDARLAKLKQTLAITTGEESAWNGFAQVSRSNATNLSSLYEQRMAGLAKMNAVQNMESYAGIASKQADDMNALTAAFQTLYGKLTPTQQHKVDAMFRAEAQKHMAKHMRAMKKKKAQ